MEQKATKFTTEELLLQAREEGLQELTKANAMRAHGKVLGMDTFSWINPQIDNLATVLKSFPFTVIWVGSHDQVKACLENYPELADNVETVIIHDRSVLNLNREILRTIKNIACIDGTTEALEMSKSLKIKKGVLLYTTNCIEPKKDKEDFEQFITLFR